MNKLTLLVPIKNSISVRYRIVSILLLLICVSCYPTDISEAEIQEDLAQSIDRNIMCPVCPSETIDESQVPIAKQMRDIVREKLSLGETKEEILDYFSQRYGEAILAKPTTKGFNLIVWIIPPIIVAIGMVLVVVVVRSMRRVSSDLGQLSYNEGTLGLESYLEIVDRKIDQIKNDLYKDIGNDRD